MSEERSYVIGTHDAEIARLGVQHRVWRSSVLDFWNVCGIAPGQTIIDAGAGPGYASIDLAEIAGPAGKVIALERSRRFLDALGQMAKARGLANIEATETDLLDYRWPHAAADRIWCRWVLTFVSDPGRVLSGMIAALKPGGRLLIQEYYDYASWRLAPYSPEFEAYVRKIIARWRASGGEPDIGLALPKLLPDAGFIVESVRPVVFTAHTNDFNARWPMDFARQYVPTLVETGDMAKSEAAALETVLDRYDADPDALVITPGLLQIVARKP